MSRIEQVMRELSDLRDFQLKLERRHDAMDEDDALSVAEEPSATIPELNRRGIRQIHPEGARKGL